MEPSERVKNLTPSLTLSISAKAKAMQAEGVDVIGFGAGEPDFDTPEHIKAAGLGSLDAGFTKYTPAAGIPELRTAISEKLEADNNLKYDPNQVIVTSGAKHALYNAFMAILNPGDEVLIPGPYWLSYPEMVRVAGGEPIIAPTTRESGYKLTADQFYEYMSPLTKAVVLNTPGNPTGTVYTDNELAAIAEVALDEEILIISDEIYEKLIYDDLQHHSVASFSNEVYNSTITINGFSKAYSMTGWRLGYLAAPTDIANKIEAMQSHTTSNPTSFAQKGGLAAIKGPQECVEEMRVEYDKRRKRVIDILGTIPRLSFSKPQGAFYALIDITQTGKTSLEFAEELLDRKKVAVVPGIAFGDDNTIRISYATSMANIEEGLQRISDFIVKE